jgi:diguanylate cyclase (GGDEF)-like protein
MLKKLDFQSTSRKYWVLAFDTILISLLISILISLSISYLYFSQLSYLTLVLGVLSGLVVSITALITGLIHNKRIHDELMELSLTDELTGLNNRRGFVFLADHLLKVAMRDREGIYILFSDLDNLKQINDTYGHLEGDKALTGFAQLLKTNYRESDIKARMGGDEFVLLPVGTSKDGMQVIRKRFDQALDEFNQTHGHPWTLAASVGLAYFDPENPVTVNELLKQADESMYAHKRQKSNL